MLVWKIFNSVLLTAIWLTASMSSAEPMQHGFILGEQDTFMSHLVATGHHSHQVSVVGELKIFSEQEQNLFQARRRIAEDSYFIFQAQDLELTEINVGQVLSGYIIESELGNYQTENRIVNEAAFTVTQVPLSVTNPFF